ncbi:MAG TPA: CDP-diacylglycerol diphosphatase [Roseiarcus sp.]|jgi:CDP-diacylglycerol pyrophosphatase
MRPVHPPLALFAAVLLSLAAASPARADRMALWTIVHGQCVPHVEAGQGPKPCERVDIEEGESKGFALLKDLHGVAQYLAIPTSRVTGIEDAQILAPDAPNYFAYAWANRDAVEAKLGHALPREAVGVSINSEFSRSQDQLHLHIDCMDKEVAAALEEYKPSLDDQWRVMTVALKGRRYWARRLDSVDLAAAAPFRLLADGLPGAKDHMGAETLIAVGAEFAGKPGFILLADQAELTGGGHAEDLQDHDCAIAGR